MTENQVLRDVATNFRSIAMVIKIDEEDAGKLLVAARLFDRARDLAEAGADQANRQADRLIDALTVSVSEKQ